PLRVLDVRGGGGQEAGAYGGGGGGPGGRDHLAVRVVAQQDEPLRGRLAGARGLRAARAAVGGEPEALEERSQPGATGERPDRRDDGAEPGGRAAQRRADLAHGVRPGVPDADEDEPAGQAAPAEVAA